MNPGPPAGGFRGNLWQNAAPARLALKALTTGVCHIRGGPGVSLVRLRIEGM
jgi:hypothetical protein